LLRGCRLGSIRGGPKRSKGGDATHSPAQGCKFSQDALLSGRNNYRYHLDSRYRTKWSRTGFSGFVRYWWSRRRLSPAKAGKNLGRDHRYRTTPENPGAGPISAIPVVDVLSVVTPAAQLPRPAPNQRSGDCRRQPRVKSPGIGSPGPREDPRAPQKPPESRPKLGYTTK
jgi:hypothetical protein